MPIEDPPTNPFGFRPVPAPRPGPAEPPAPFPGDHIARSAGPLATPDPADHLAAAGLAGAFAVDYLSWDEDEPERRGRVLRSYLPASGGDPALLGWSGRGRQRAELAFPLAATRDAGGRLIVEVRVRVTPYRSVGVHGNRPAEDGEPDADGTPAVAPAPSGRGWRGLASRWTELSVPVLRDGDKLVVDIAAGCAGGVPVRSHTPPLRRTHVGACVRAPDGVCERCVASARAEPERGSGFWPTGQNPDTVSL